MRPSFFHHLHPPTIPARQARWRYTLGAGGLSVFFCLVLTLTGMLEMFFYIPTPEQAAGSVQLLTYLVPYGRIVRNLHYWSAQALVITAGIHLLRVIFTGAYAPPRRFNYWLGLTLFILLIFLNFTGYILRWDEGIRWALVAGTNLIKSIPGIGDVLYILAMGSSRPGAATLTRFYSWHLFGLTLAVVILGTWHIFRVRRDGGIAVPPAGQRPDSERITRFELVRREVLAALLAAAGLLLLSALVPAPIGPAMTTVSPQAAEARAPWFFLWVQQLLRWGNPFWLGVVVPIGIVLFLGLIPVIFPPPRPEELGTWFPPSGRPVQIITAALVLALIVLTILALRPV